jgi:hypothetical protein
MNLDKELQKFLDEHGRVKKWPSRPAKQMLVLKYLASRFVLGKHYTEAEVNQLLSEYHTFGDPALLRRELVMKGLFDRADNGSAYWKKSE